MRSTKLKTVVKMKSSVRSKKKGPSLAKSKDGKLCAIIARTLVNHVDPQTRIAIGSFPLSFSSSRRINPSFNDSTWATHADLAERMTSPHWISSQEKGYCNSETKFSKQKCTNSQTSG